VLQNIGCVFKTTQKISGLGRVPDTAVERLLTSTIKSAAGVFLAHGLYLFVTFVFLFVCRCRLTRSLGQKTTSRYWARFYRASRRRNLKTVASTTTRC